MGTRAEQAPPVAIFTVREVAHALRLTPKAVYNRIEAGELLATRLGHGPRAPIRISAIALAGFLEREAVSARG